MRRGRVQDLLKLTDPGGNPTEIFYGPRIESDLPFWSGRRLHGNFVTGDRGLGQDDLETAARFYRGALGMAGGVEVRNDAPAGGSVARRTFQFFSCNRREHSLGFGNIKPQKRVTHIVSEMSSMDDVWTAYALAKKNVPIVAEVGKHSNDKAVSFYCTTPSGFMWEIGWNVGPPEPIRQYSPRDVWGHEQPGH